MCAVCRVEQGANGMLCDADNETPLHKAASEGHLAVAAYLLRMFPGAAAVKDRKGHTPKDRATGQAKDLLDWNQIGPLC